MSRQYSNWFVAKVAPLVSATLRSSRRVKKVVAASSDVLAALLASWLSFALRLGSFEVATQPFAIFTAIATVASLAVFAYWGVYNSVFRFHGPKGFGQIARACLTVMVLLVIVFGIISMRGVPRTVSGIFPIVLFMTVAVSRIVARFVLVEMMEGGEAPKRVAIYGAGTAGRQLAISLHHERGYRLVMFADDEPSLHGQRLEGTPISSGSALEMQLADSQIDLVLLAMPGITHSERARIVSRLKAYDVHVQSLPGIHAMVAGEVSINDLREIDITELLSREQVPPDIALMERGIVGRTVLVTGAGGSIGSELCRQIVRFRPTRLIMFDMTEAALFEIDSELRRIAAAEGLTVEVVAELGTLVNREAVDRLFARYRPQTVFHAAAYKHVPLVESNPVAGVHNNISGTLYCALAAMDAGCDRFVLVSTDKAVRPTNVMGASKRVCELILQALAAREGAGTVFSMVRFGNVLGSSGSVVPHFRRQIAEGGPVTLTDKAVTRYFMTIPEAAELVIQAGAMASGGEVYLLEMGESVRIYDLAVSMIRLSGRSVRDAANPQGDIEIVEIGLRPGEKLYEELLVQAEARPTDHPRIYRAHEQLVPWDKLRRSIAALEEAAQRADGETIKGLLAQLVDGYAPAVDARTAGAFAQSSPSNTQARAS